MRGLHFVTTVLLLGAAASWCPTGAFAQTATISRTNSDPRNALLVDRDWSGQLRNFSGAFLSSEIWIGSGNLSDSRNRKSAELRWRGANTFTFTYAPSPALITLSAAGDTNDSEDYDFQRPVDNANLPFNNLLIELESPDDDLEIRILDLTLAVVGGATTNLGSLQVTSGDDVFGRIANIGTAYSTGFTLTGTIIRDEDHDRHGGSSENPTITIWGLQDRTLGVPDLTLTKSHTGSFTQGQAGATYTVTVSNIGSGSTAGTVTVVDNFPPSLLPAAASGPGWTCTISTNSATCTRSNALAPGSQYPPITLTVNVASTAPALANNAAAVSGGSDNNSANNTVVDPTVILRGPDLSITKTANGTFTQGQVGAGYTLAVGNAGGAATSGIVTVTDNLPTGLVPVSASGTGWTCGVSGTTVVCSRSDALAAGTAYPPITLNVNVAGNAAVSVTNTATVAGGGDLDAANNSASAVTLIARAPDLTITKSHTGTFVQGQTATFAVTVTNNGPASTTGLVVVTDPMVLPLTPRTGSGSGWTCDVLTDLVRCQRSDALAAGASYPPITIAAAIAPNAPPSVVNGATVSGGGDANTANNSATDTATVLPGPDLTLTKGHTGTFVQGQSGTYTVTVTNAGGSPTTGTVTLSDTLPSGLAATTATGTGWTCTVSPPSVSCTRGDALSAGQSYPAITLGVAVSPDAPASVTNTASVFGGGDVNDANNSAADPTTIAGGPDLTIAKTHTGDFTQGQSGTYTVTVSNVGASPTIGSVQVTDNLPTGLIATAAAGTGWTCPASGQSFPCTRSDALAPGASYPPITLTVDVAANAPASVTNAVTVVGGGDVDSSQNTASDPTTVIQVPDVTITKTHTGSFLQGQVGATYAVTVTNAGSVATTAPVTVTDSVPVGLTPTAAAGAGWVCSIAGQDVTCLRSDALGPSGSFPNITLTVNVAPAAPSSLTNTATVAGGGQVNTTNDTASDITTIGPGADLTISKSHTGPFLQGQVGAIYTLTIDNRGTAATTGIVTVTDPVPSGLVPTAASGTGWTCTIAAQDATCSRSDPLAPGTAFPSITLTVDVDPGVPALVTNTASVAGGGDVNPTNNTATDRTVTVPGADVTITKTHAGTFVQGQPAAIYTVTVTNAGVGPTDGAVTVTDTLPTGLTPVAADGAGWTCSVGPLAVSCSRSDPLAAGTSHPPVSVTVSVAVDAPATVTNIASVTGGGDSNSGNNSASDPTTILGGPDLTITASHAGNFFQGQHGATWTIAVTNSGASPTTAAVTITNALPMGLVAESATGTGWSCQVSGQVLRCDRSDPLAPGAGYPPVTVSANVAPDAPASLTNIVNVAGGGDVDGTDNSATDVITIGPGPDLSLTKTHASDFVQGQIGAAYTLTASNAGGVPSVGTVIVNDVLPAALTPTGAAGAGWTCAVSGNGVQCERADPVAPAGSYAPIVITANVAADAPLAVTNTALVSGGGDVNGANNVASDPTTVVRGPDLTLTKSHTAIFRQGGRAAADALFYTLTVANAGTAATSGTVTLIDNVPPGLIPASVSGTGWACSLDQQSVACTRSDPLAGGASYPPVQLGVDVESDAPAVVVNTATIAGGGDVQASNNSASDSTQVNRGQNLTITKTHAGNFAQGQIGAAYTITVTNSGGAPTLGTVTLVDHVPTGLALTAATGPGWTCTVSGATVDCARADPLAGGASYEPVTVTVDVLADAPPSVVNTALVAGGGDVFPPDNVATDTTVVAPGPDATITKVHPLGFSPGQTSGVFQITVTNAGGSPTSGTIDVVDDIPVGLTATAAEGPGWSCEVAVDTVACSRSDVLAPASSFAPITLTVDVDPDVAIGSSLINEANVFIRGENNIGNNSAEDLVLVSLYTLHFAEGATGSFFRTDVGVLNASATAPANVTFNVLPDAGPAVPPLTFTLPPLGRRSVDLNTLLGGRSGSTRIESDQPIAATRQMTWGNPAYGSTLESGIARASATWLFAEGATNVYSLYYLLENPNTTAAQATLTHFVERGASPVSQSLTIPPSSRVTILVNDVPGLASTALSTLIAADVPIVAERAMYLNSAAHVWEAGTASVGAIAPSTIWSFAEGATGFFHTYLLLGNPDVSPASVTVTYKFPAGTTITKTYTVLPQARLTVDVNNDDPLLASTSVAMEVVSPVPIVAERAMWWQGYPWSEGSSAIGSTMTGALWAIGEGTEGGPLQASTFVLVANASVTPGTVRFTVAYDDGTTEQKDFALVANARLTVRIGEPANFPNASGRAFSVLVESMTDGMPITVEYARYQTSASLLDSGGAALANRIR